MGRWSGVGGWGPQEIEGTKAQSGARAEGVPRHRGPGRCESRPHPSRGTHRRASGSLRAGVAVFTLDGDIEFTASEVGLQAR